MTARHHYPAPVLVINMALLQGIYDFLLKTLRKFIVAIELVGITFNALLEIGDLFRGHTTPTSGRDERCYW